MQLDLKSTSKKLLYLFLATDIVFIILYLLYVYSDGVSNPYFSIEKERGYAEFFQYIKEYWIVILLGIVAINKRSLLYLSWSFLFVYLLLDDSLAIHETLGGIISGQLSLSDAFNLRALDYGELLVSGFFGLFFLVLIGTAYRFGDRVFRKASRSLIKMLLALVVCGIVVDMIHMAARSPSLGPLLVVLEDGGEMVVMSIIAWFAFLLSGETSASTNANVLEEQFSRHRTEVASHQKF